MKGLRAVVMAFSMYSRLPMPKIGWDEESRVWALCAFPLTGAAVGGAWLLWGFLARLLSVGVMLRGAVFAAIPLAITGGIHMDGFCDTVDALASNQSRERKLEILSDPHIGAFAVMGCGVWLLLDFGLWCQIDITSLQDRLCLALLPVLSRCLSARAALTERNARGSGLLACFTEGDAKLRRRFMMVFMWIIFVLMCQAVAGLAAALCAILAALWCRRLARLEFGGMTGDLAGWLLQITELAGLAGLVLAQRLLEVLVR